MLMERQGPEGRVSAMVGSFDGRMVAVGSDMGEVLVYDQDKGIRMVVPVEGKVQGVGPFNDRWTCMLTKKACERVHDLLANSPFNNCDPRERRIIASDDPFDGETPASPLSSV